MADLFAKKPLNIIMSEADEHGEHSLRRALGPTNLISLGIGAIIGTGIFVLTGTASAAEPSAASLGGRMAWAAATAYETIARL